MTKTLSHPAVLFLHSFSFQSKSLPQTLQQKERRILLKLKTEWRNPPSLSNWTMESNGDHCSWPEIICATDGTINGIFLLDKNLSFPIPPSICDLTNLTHIDLSWNNTPGPFPISLSNCSNLQYLDFSSNNFVGRLPPDIDRLSSLRSFSISSNNFTGDIPPEIGHMSNLTMLCLSGNLFNGSVPSEIGDLENLGFLGLGYLSIMPQWRIPPEFGRLKKLETVSICGSNLIGDVGGKNDTYLD
ncbi:hypothetical protein MRB53_012932 [Persea americana]|uniref:Uncharacterized protein n=1 Tax=Persea americana TaxID=3435 RepID=A0ACC2LZ34_PERAE|nr:hypothetical protein MRB53_012932 [Persea americana]